MQSRFRPSSTCHSIPLNQRITSLQSIYSDTKFFRVTIHSEIMDMYPNSLVSIDDLGSDNEDDHPPIGKPSTLPSTPKTGEVLYKEEELREFFMDVDIPLTGTTAVQGVGNQTANKTQVNAAGLSSSQEAQPLYDSSSHTTPSLAISAIYHSSSCDTSSPSSSLQPFPPTPVNSSDVFVNMGVGRQQQPIHNTPYNYTTNYRPRRAVPYNPRLTYGVHRRSVDYPNGSGHVRDNYMPRAVHYPNSQFITISRFRSPYQAIGHPTNWVPFSVTYHPGTNTPRSVTFRNTSVRDSLPYSGL
ncbi:uncharacterized protein LOC142242501 isoform X2 [Haematobia irritans]|uniref:uncharacterized protein LOC142242501 isoform X2 n=1 Tax=Haematobia irritans TaxID=7368 RepID=UPI003F503502